MSDRTTLLFALPDFRVLDVTLERDGGRRVLVETVAEEGGCPDCGVLSSVIKDRPTSRVKDVPHGLVPLQLWVRKRRFACGQALCDRRSFTETSEQLPARARVTTRLKVKVAAAVSTTNHRLAVAETSTEVAITYDVAAALRGLRLLDPAGERLVFRIRAHRDHAVLLASEDDLEELIGSVAAEANHEPNRRRQRQLDAAFEVLNEAAAEA